MPVTALLVFREANAQTINVVKGALYPIFPTEVPEPWGLEYKLFRENPDSISPFATTTNNNNESGLPQAKQSRFLTHLSLDHHRGNIYVQIDPQIRQQHDPTKDNTNNSEYPSPPPPIVTMEPGFDSLVTRKLQSLWVLRQTLRGEGGLVYSCNDGMFWLRIVTVTQNGSAFKMLLMEIECTSTAYLNDGKAMIQSFLQSVAGLPPYKIIYGLDQTTSQDDAKSDANTTSSQPPIDEFTYIQTVQQYFTVFRSRY